MQKEIKKLIQKLVETDVDFVVEHPADLSHGDYSTNIAMVLAKKLEKNPRELAEDIVKKIESKISMSGKPIKSSYKRFALELIKV
jgi:arginyl-tRNA synthetase